MRTHDEFDRSLAAWFEADAAATAPIGLLDEATAATATRSPRPAWRANLRGHFPSDDRRAVDGLAKGPMRRVALALVIAIGLALLTSAALLVAGHLVTPSPQDATDSGTFAATGPMLMSRGHPHMGPTFTATLLADGRVLVVGGIAGGEAPIAGAETWDPLTGTFSATGDLVVARGDHSTTLLLDGRVLVVGGYGVVGGGTNSVASAEIWDPVAGTFALAGSLTANRRQHTATLLLDGRVLIAGGTDDTFEILPAAEIFDPDTGQFTALGPPVDAIKGRSATRLGDGRVLLVGGSAGAAPIASADLWDPATGMYTPTGSLAEPRFGHTAMLLPDGRVLVVGGQDAEDMIATAEVWEPGAGEFRRIGPVPGVRYGTAITMLRDGTILLIGGSVEDPFTGVRSDDVGATAYRWDPATGLVSSAGSLTDGRATPAATLLTDGRVLVVGGDLSPEPPVDSCSAGLRSGIRTCRSVDSSLASAELWTPRDWSP